MADGGHGGRWSHRGTKSAKRGGELRRSLRLAGNLRSGGDAERLCAGRCASVGEIRVDAPAAGQRAAPTPFPEDVTRLRHPPPSLIGRVIGVEDDREMRLKGLADERPPYARNIKTCAPGIGRD